MSARLNFIILIVAWFSYDLSCQSFEIPIYFEDSAGFKDTIILGYDPLASYGIDTSFGEINIIDSSYNELFEVRAAIYDYNYFFEHGILLRVVESKKLINEIVCFEQSYSGEENSIMVVIKSENWPITMSWDSSLFLDVCNYIDIIDCTPGGWFDVCGGGPNVVMMLTNTATYYDTDFKMETEDDTLNALFFRFFRDFGSSIDDNPIKNIEFYPNPSSGVIHLKNVLNSYDKISITDINGRTIPFNYSDQKIDLSLAPDGIYLLTIKFLTGENIVMKVIKKAS